MNISNRIMSYELQVAAQLCRTVLVARGFLGKNIGYSS